VDSYLSPFLIKSIRRLISKKLKSKLRNQIKLVIPQPKFNIKTRRGTMRTKTKHKLPSTAMKSRDIKLKSRILPKMSFLVATLLWHRTG